MKKTKGKMLLIVIMVKLLLHREIEARLEKQKATRQYVQEFLQKREEVIHVQYVYHAWPAHT